MAKNQRQRRPLQDESRQEKQTVRERAQASRRQRDRIEENRDRREQRRERNRLRRQTVDSVRSPKEDVRIDRMDSRLVPVEDTFLGRPVGTPTDLPVVIGERWGSANDITCPTGSETTVTFNTAAFTTERNGYPALYTPSTGIWRVPAGLAGIWYITAQVHWDSKNIDDSKIVAVKFVGGATIAESFIHQVGTVLSEPVTQLLTGIYNFQEGDEFYVRATQSSGFDQSVIGTVARTWAFAQFLGK